MPDEPSEPTNDAEQIEQLLAFNSALKDELSLARQELAAASPLLLSFGTGLNRYVVNGRSIRGMHIQQKSTTFSTGFTTWEELWAVMVDEARVTDFLDQEQAIAALAEAEARWAQALESNKK